MKQYTVIVAIKVSAYNEQEAVPKFYKECTLKNAIKHDIPWSDLGSWTEISKIYKKDNFYNCYCMVLNNKML